MGCGVATRAHAAILSAVPDLIEVDLHLELFVKGEQLSRMEDLPAAFQLPGRAEAEAWLRKSREALCASGCSDVGSPPPS